MISVIVPIYNAEKYLSKCLDSIINQEFKDIEILCVDDGSTDSSFNIALEYQNKDSRIKLFKQSNKGPGAARNTGLDNASGDYVLFIDADDEITTGALSVFYNEINSSKSDVVIGSYNHYIDDELIETVRPHECLTSFESYYRTTAVWSKIFKRGFIGDIRFQNVYQGEDVIFITDLLLKSPKVSYIEDIVYYWKSYTNSNSLLTDTKRNIFGEQLDSVLLVKEKLSVLSKKGILADDINYYFIRVCSYLLSITKKCDLNQNDIEKYFCFINSIDWTGQSNVFINIFHYPCEEVNNIDKLIERITNIHE